jgi:L-ribulose-5-phosphate 4-epimerase
MLEDLKRQVCQANLDLVAQGLVTLTWGNVSGVSQDRQLLVIKPSGVCYDELIPERMVVVKLSDGEVIEGGLRPSSDTPTHRLLYEEFPNIGGIAHTHSQFATAFAQARREIPCFGTTHADHFYGPIPVTRQLSEAEVKDGYELNTGRVIMERFSALDPMAIPGVLVVGHAPFAWGRDANKAVENAVVLEAVAAMAFRTLALTSGASTLEQYVLDKHYSRKHGDQAYYGQK